MCAGARWRMGRPRLRAVRDRKHLPGSLSACPAGEGAGLSTSPTIRRLCGCIFTRSWGKACAKPGEFASPEGCEVGVFPGERGVEESLRKSCAAESHAGVPLRVLSSLPGNSKGKRGEHGREGHHRKGRKPHQQVGCTSAQAACAPAEPRSPKTLPSKRTCSQTAPAAKRVRNLPPCVQKPHRAQHATTNRRQPVALERVGPLSVLVARLRGRS